MRAVISPASRRKEPNASSINTHKLVEMDGEDRHHPRCRHTILIHAFTCWERKTKDALSSISICIGLLHYLLQVVQVLGEQLPPYLNPLSLFHRGLQAPPRQNFFHYELHYDRH